jgi:3-hydroxyacyl-CoA dehydrogenase
MTEITDSIKAKVDGIQNVTVLGAGTMGSGISRLFSSLGYNVRVVDPFEKNLKKTAAVAKITEENLFESLTKEAVDDTDLVVEAVTENPQLKKEQVYDVLATFYDEGSLKEGILVSSNTSSIPIQELGASLPEAIRPSFLGTHFFNPAHYMKLIELIPCKDTSDETYEAFYYLSHQKLLKEIATAADLPGFIVNRLLLLDYGHVFKSLADGEYEIEEIDYVMGAPVGRPMGFFQLADLIGNDLFPSIGKVIYDGVEGDPYRDYFKMPDYLTKMINKKLLGAKTGGLGFYKTEKRKAVGAYDVKEEDYRELKKPKFDSVEAAIREKDIIKRAHKLLYPETEDRGTEIARRFMGLLLKYTDMLTGEIGEAQDIEIAMCYGLNHRVGPVGFLQSEYGDDFRELFPN